MKIGIIITLLCLCATACISQTIETYLPGKWKVEGKETFEKWELKSESWLEGYGYKMVAGEQIVTEKLKLLKEGDCWSYQATVGNQNDGEPISFKQNCDVSDKWLFENLNHDFPKKIIYSPISDTEIFVKVLGDEDKGFSFYMNKVE